MNTIKFEINPHHLASELETHLSADVRVYDKDVTEKSIEFVIYDYNNDDDGRTLILEVSGRWLWLTDIWFTRTLCTLYDVQTHEQLAKLIADALQGEDNA